MTIWTPGWLQGGTYTAQQDRINSRAADWDEGVGSRADLKVTQRGAGANLSVDVAIGDCVVTGDDQVNQGNYNVYNDAVFNLTGFSAPGSNSRYDLVGIQINDPNAGGNLGNNAVIIRVAGTAAASPTVPATPASFLPLAIIGPILTSTTQITTAMIHDAYTGTGPTGVAGVRLLQGFRDAPGTLKDTFNAVAPNGWLVAAGQAVSRTAFAALFEHFGTTFGAGDGASTFNLPDLRGRVMVALDNQGGTDAGKLAAGNTLGGSGGEETHTLTAAESGMPAHTPSASLGVQSADHVHSGNTGGQSASHTHVLPTGLIQNAPGLFVQNSASGYNYTPINGGTDFASNDHTHAFTSGGVSANHTHALTINGVAAQNAASSHNVMQPYILGYKIVRT